MPLIPLKVRSYGRKPVAYCAVVEETVQVVASVGVATIYVATAGQRERILKQIKSDLRKEVAVNEIEIIGIRLVIFERGWPTTLPRLVLCHHIGTEHGVSSYSKTLSPYPGRLTFLAPGAHPHRRIASVEAATVAQATVAGSQVSLRLRGEDWWQSIIIVADSPGSANHLHMEIRAQAGGTIEINDSVRSIILSRPVETRIYEFDNLPEVHRQALLANGARLIARPTFTGEHSADSYEGYPFYKLDIPIEQVPGFGPPANTEVQR